MAERRNSSDSASDSSSSEASGTLVSSSSHEYIGIDDSTILSNRISSSPRTVLVLMGKMIRWT